MEKALRTSGQMYDEIFLPWETSYDCPPLNDDMVRHAENVLGYTLPQSYIDLLQVKNGGFLNRDTIEVIIDNRTLTFTINPIMGIGGDEGIDSLREGKAFSEFLIDQWYYPHTGVVISHMGHAGCMLDYSACGRDGQPSVIYGYFEMPTDIQIIPLASSLAEFLLNLKVNSERNWHSALSDLTDTGH